MPYVAAYAMPTRQSALIHRFHWLLWLSPAVSNLQFPYWLRIMRSIITLALLAIATEAFMPATPGKAVSVCVLQSEKA
jgi:hypothetical protein